MGYQIKTTNHSWGAIFDLYLTGVEKRVASTTVYHTKILRESRKPTIDWSALNEKPIEVARDFAAGLIEIADIADRYLPKIRNDIPNFSPLPIPAPANTPNIPHAQ